MMHCVVMVAIGATIALAETKSDKKDGFKPLFNGKDLTGWVEIGSKGAWSVADGVLKCDGKNTGYAWLCTEKKYGNFVVELEYKVGKEANTGVFCLVPQREGRASMLGFEAQITDQTEGELTKHTPGSIWERAVAKRHAGKPAGEWNKMQITVKGNAITIVLNGKVVNEIDKSKIESMKDVPNEGYIGLQNHGTPSDFRNVRIKQL
jgi:hypothetical protein